MAAERSNRAANRKELSETTWYPHSCDKNARFVFGLGEPVLDLLAPALRDKDGGWPADYDRLRFGAVKADGNR